MTPQKFKQTEIGKIPEDWKETILGNHLKLNYGKSLPEKERKFGKIPVYGSNGITGFHTISLVKGPGIILGRKGSVGEIKFSKNDFWPIDTTYYLTKEDTSLNLIFLYYKLLTLNINKMNSHAAVPGLNREDVYIIETLIPKSSSEQHSIASILSSLDSKIELNNKINKTLESIGQTIFKKWFVDGTKEEWKEGKLGDYVESISGCSYTSEGLESSENALVTLKSIGVNGFKQEGFKEYTGRYNEKHVVQDGDIVVAHTDLTQDRIILGKPVIVRDFGKYKKMIASMDLSIVRPIKLINKPYLFYLLNTDVFHGYAQGYSNGTTVIHLSRKAIPEFTFLIPDKELLERFKILSDKLFNKIRFNDMQNQILSSIRDALLPKLMSGEIRVK